MAGSVDNAGTVVPVRRSFAVRGVVEGFYGTPWTHDARLDVITFLAERGANAYVYAPKDDALHRAEWRTPYDRAALERFRGLAATGSTHGVRFGFAISPGLDIEYDSEADRAMLLRKLQPLRDAGVSWFLLLLDDIPLRPGLAPRQAALVTWLHDALDGASLTMCPTEYVGTHPSPYLSDLGAGMPADVDVMWTGPTVCSPQLRAADARGWTKALGERRVIVWDNYPVNDALMTASLHLGAYAGRDPDLADVVGGVLCNPMIQPYASKLPLATAMEFLSDPDGYDIAVSYPRAIADVGGARDEALAVLARACMDSPIALPGGLDLNRRVGELGAALEGPDWAPVLAAVHAELRRAKALPDAFPEPAPSGDGLAADVGPWATAAAHAADAGLAALRLIQCSRPAAVFDDTGLGRVGVPDPETAMHTAFLVLYLWKAARSDEKVVYGPRFALYSPVVQLADGSPALDAAAAVREDANAIDALCRLALRTYDAWRTTAAGQPATVKVDGRPVELTADGTFDADGDEVTLRQGPLTTRVAVGSAPIFSDRRFA
jgi:hyaluronoglucosaminidase